MKSSRKDTFSQRSKLDAPTQTALTVAPARALPGKPSSNPFLSLTQSYPLPDSYSGNLSFSLFLVIATTNCTQTWCQNNTLPNMNSWKSSLFSSRPDFHHEFIKPLEFARPAMNEYERKLKCTRKDVVFPLLLLYLFF